MASKTKGRRHLFPAGLREARDARHGAPPARPARPSRALRLGLLESLEERVLLAITVALSGNAVSFTGDGQADNLILKVTGGDLAYSVDGGTTFSENLNPAQSGTNMRTIGSLSSIVVDLKTGADTLSIDPSLSAALTAAGVPLTYTASTSGELGSLAGATNPSNNWVITGPNAGTLDGKISFSGIGQIDGGTLGDTFFVQPFGGSGALAVAGHGTSDFLDYTLFSSAVNVDLATGNATNLGSVTGIENVRGGSGNDTLTGDGENNTLVAGKGNVTLSGGGGADQYVFPASPGQDTVNGEPWASGGSGTLDFSAATANLNVAVNADATVTATVGAGTVKASNITGLIGGHATNTLDYSAYASAVTVNLTTGQATDFTSLSGFENVVGSNFDDNLVGDGKANTAARRRGQRHALRRGWQRHDRRRDRRQHACRVF